MAQLSVFLLSALLLAPSVNAQAFDASERGDGAFSYVQPLNTTILGPYGHSPAVLPSRRSQSLRIHTNGVLHKGLTGEQQMRRE